MTAAATPTATMRCSSPAKTGLYDVEARFCDLSGNGHLTPCERRIDLHWAADVEDED
jgi:hypothetical protein